MGIAESKEDIHHEESLPLLHKKSNKNITMNRRSVASNHHHNRANKLGHDIDVGLVAGIWKWKGTVLSRIWPTVLLFMIYAAGVRSFFSFSFPYTIPPLKLIDVIISGSIFAHGLGNGHS